MPDTELPNANTSSWWTARGAWAVHRPRGKQRVGMRLPSGRLAGSILPLGTIFPQLRFVDYPLRVLPRTNCRPCRQL